MRNFHCLTSQKILSINNPELLFSNSLSEAKREYRQLALLWHPDNMSNPEAPAVFGHIAHLYKEAQQKLETGKWIEPCEKVEQETKGIKKFRLENGVVRTIQYLSIRPFELGTMFIGEHTIAFEVKDEFADLFHNARRQIRSLKFKDEKMAVELGKNLPQVDEAFKTNTSCILILRKTPDQLLLSDVLRHFSGKLPPEHVGWILNVAWNIACYLEWTGVAHNAISPFTFFISPLRHDGMLLGGWWYAASFGSRLTALPDRSMRFIPPDIINRGFADTRADLELVKTLGRELLGDALGVGLQFDKSLPPVLTKYLTLPAGEKAADNYKEWKYNVLESCFGPPKFLPLKLESKDIYKEI